jgi:hypothetical protein
MHNLYISYGLTKSASTFAWQLIKEIAIQGGLPVAALSIKSKGRNSPEDYIDPVSAEKLELIRQDIGDAPAVIKTHGDATPAAIQLVAEGRALVFVSYRDLRDIALSLLDHAMRSRRKGIPDFANLYTIRDTVVSLKNQVKRFENWVRTCAPFLISYDEICFDTGTTITRIAERIGVEVNAEAIRNKFISDPRVIGQFNKGEKRRFEHEMEPSVSAGFIREFEDYFTRYFPEEAGLLRSSYPEISGGEWGELSVLRTGQSELPARAPICIMSFDRPDYLRQVLVSLKAQIDADIENRKIILFQDGALSRHNKHRHADDQAIADCIDAFKSAFPAGVAMASPKNLGVALNFDRAERVGFEQLAEDAVIFLEDDLVLSEHYIATLDLLIERFRFDERVGYLAAYGDLHRGLSDQRANRTKLIRMGHNWGFALYRRQWLRMRNRVLDYLDLIRDVDYRLRDGAKIARLFASWGYGCPATSQDAAKTIACCSDKVARLNTYACNARYIGERGLHMRPVTFRERGYDKTIVFPERVTDFAPLDAELYDRCIREQERWAGKAENSETQTPVKANAEGPPATANERRNAGGAFAISRKIFGEEVLTAYVPEFEEDLQGWNSTHPIFREIISTGAVRTIFDVGVWKGASTIGFADLLKRFEVDGVVVAIDTFLGSPEHWNRSREDKIFNSLRIQHGYPRLYRQFASNVKHRKCEGYVVPLPQTTENAAKILRNNGIRADLIHLDAAHEYEIVLRDALCYWSLLNPGGFLIGDDYHPTWPGVVNAANDFAHEVGLRLEVHEPKWLVRKPSN